MNRKQYLLMRNNNSIEVFYEYYKEFWNKEKHIFMLNAEEFFRFINMWPGAQEAYEKVLTHYDIKFTVQKVENLKTGQIIKYM